MEYRVLGRTGLKVSELCLGAMTFGREASEPDSHVMMDVFAAAGGNFIDTADAYSQGGSEEVVGRWLKGKRREDFVIATKVRFGMGSGPNDIGLSRKHIMDGVEASLRRLQVDVIDLYQVHCWDPITPLEETLHTLDLLIQQGKVRYIGVSNYKAHQIQKAVDISRANGWQPFVCLQPLYNLLDRALEWEIVEVCQNEGLGIIPWSPLRGGWLTGRYTRGMQSLPEGSRVAAATANNWTERWDVYDNDRTWSVIDTLKVVAGELGRTPAEVALNWVKDRPGVTAPIIGASKISQLESNLKSVGWALSDEHRARLDVASDLPGPYPFDFIAKVGGRR
ncbi:MAG: aldo/keto reductase [Chloroflexota bacterium]|nr:aldo/keto reductase [Chloroflexota bacterium]OQY82573.1 MAG: aldo/keto reductase [Anaerolineae bacterium UTCFX5]